MKALSDALAAHLQSGATTLCWCWRLTRRDGARLGFTDHDRDLVFDDTTFEAASGFTASEIRDQVGLSVDNLEVTGALVSDRLCERALAAGDFDDAGIEIFRVNWQDTAQRVLMRSGSLGEVRRTGTAFSAEVRGLAHYLQQPKGRLFQYTCDADLGDARCGVDLASPAYRASGTVLAVTGTRRLAVDGLADYAAGWFTRGVLSFASGANVGRAMEIKNHAHHAGTIEIELWQSMGEPVAAGDAIIVVAGCDKRLQTCAARFANAVNYRGFPHMPGNDFVTAIAEPGNTPRPAGSSDASLG
ncbi:MAG: DUF2163 domain-containing protein [Hyphomicrobiaceae bacterium]